MVHLAKIFIYPIKSLDGIALDEVAVSSGGSLQGDRCFAFFDAAGKYVNGKRNSKIYQLRATFDRDLRSVALSPTDGEPATFSLEGDLQPLEAWASAYFGFPVFVRRNDAIGFPDDEVAYGPTIVGEATLNTLCTWFPQISPDEMTRRFRPNLIAAETEPFWEDGLFAEEGNVRRFRIGDVAFEGVNPCQRCIVVTKDPQTGAAYPHFQKVFTKRRWRSLPPHAIADRFNHFYRLATNTRIPVSEAGKILRVGDEAIL